MRKRRTVITTCPVCSGDLHITGLKCDTCETEIKGEFSFSKFNYLNKETLYFIELFVKNRGNIKQVEKEMNISYPTVKKYLDEAITALGYDLDEDSEGEFEEPKEEPKVSKKDFNLDVLAKIKEGTLKVEEALDKIKKGFGNNNE